MKQQINIEQLLIWAYREQCVDVCAASFRPQGPCASPANALAGYMALGTRVDNSGFAARALGSRVPDDAMIVHDTVLSLGVMYIEHTDEGHVIIWDQEKAAKEGHTITDERLADGVYQSDLVCANGYVARLIRFEPSILLIINAKNASRPEWHQGWKAPAHRLPNDNLSRDKWGRLRKTNNKTKMYEGPSYSDVIYARAQYQVWSTALSLVATLLHDELNEHEVVDDESHANPWCVHSSESQTHSTLQK